MAAILQFDPNSKKVTYFSEIGNTPDYVGKPNTIINPDYESFLNIPVRYWKWEGEIKIANSAERKEIDSSLETTDFADQIKEVVYFKRQDLVSLVCNNAEWTEYPELNLVSPNFLKEDFKLTLSCVISCEANQKEIELGIFTNNLLYFSQVYKLRDKDDDSSITLIDVVLDVEPGTNFTIKVKGGSSRNINLNSTVVVNFSRVFLLLEDI